MKVWLNKKTAQLCVQIKNDSKDNRPRLYLRDSILEGVFKNCTATITSWYENEKHIKKHFIFLGDL